VLVTGDRILIKDYGPPSFNGVYTVNASGTPTRATDFDTDDEIILGSIFYVEGGTANGGKYFYLTVGETLAANKTFTVLGAAMDISGLSAFTGTVDGAADKVAMYDSSAATNKSIIMSRLVPTYGTFTPAIAFGGFSVGVTYATQTGKYVETILNDGKYKIEFNILVSVNGKGSSTGALTVTGLPRTADGSALCAMGVNDISGSGSVAITNHPLAIVNNAATTISLYDGETDTTLTNTSIDTTGSLSAIIYLNGWYIHTP
jgi:hypothetical protein